jgi:hypothetical protein
MSVVTNLAETSGSSPPVEQDCFLSADEKKLLTRLENQFVKGTRAQAEALRDIREKKLYREDFSTFDDYVLVRWAKTRPWVTQNTNWLRIIEWLEQSGKLAYRLSVKEANYLVALEKYDAYPDLFIRAMEDAIAEANSLGKARTAQMVKAAVRRQIDFVDSGLAAYEDFLAVLKKQQQAEADKANDEKRREIKADLEALNNGHADCPSTKAVETDSPSLGEPANPVAETGRIVCPEPETPVTETAQMVIDPATLPAPSVASRTVGRHFKIELTGDFAKANDPLQSGDSEAVFTLLSTLAQVQLDQGGTISISLQG